MRYFYQKIGLMDMFTYDPKEDDMLCVVEVGYQQRICYPQYRPLFAKAHQIHFVVEGVGGINAVPLKQYEGFYVPQGETYVETSDENGMEQCWINIYGMYAQTLLNEVGITAENRIFDYHHAASDIIAAMKAFFSAHDDAVNSFDTLSLLFRLLSYLKKPEYGQNTGIAGYITAAEEYMRKNYSRPITVSDIAAALNLSPKYLSRIYSAHTNSTLIAFLTDLRMKSAAVLLRHTGESISQISREVGYKDPLYFSKAFRRCFHCSPSEYRVL